MTIAAKLEVKTAAELANQPEEYQTAVKKIVISHAVNELYGAQVFDEPAIALAPTPYAKWLTCRVAMEEYHHHVRFRGLAEEIGVPAQLSARLCALLEITGDQEPFPFEHPPGFSEGVGKDRFDAESTHPVQDCRRQEFRVGRPGLIRKACTDG